MCMYIYKILVRGYSTNVYANVGINYHNLKSVSHYYYT